MSGFCNQVRKHSGSCHRSLTSFTCTFTSLVTISIYRLREKTKFIPMSTPILLNIMSHTTSNFSLSECIILFNLKATFNTQFIDPVKTYLLTKFHVPIRTR